MKEKRYLKFSVFNQSFIKNLTVAKKESFFTTEFFEWIIFFITENRWCKSPSNMVWIGISYDYFILVILLLVFWWAFNGFWDTLKKCSWNFRICMVYWIKLFIKVGGIQILLWAEEIYEFYNDSNCTICSSKLDIFKIYWNNCSSKLEIFKFPLCPENLKCS